MHHVHFIPHQMQVQIRGSDTRVKPAGLKPYVSLPSTCMQVLTFPVCSHSLLQRAYLSLQDIGLQQEPGTDDGLYGEGHTGSNHGEASQVWYKSICYNRYVSPATRSILDLCTTTICLKVATRCIFFKAKINSDQRICIPRLNSAC